MPPDFGCPLDARSGTGGRLSAAPWKSGAASDGGKPLCDSRAVPGAAHAEIDVLRAGGFEVRAPLLGVAYARKHLAGPANPDDGKWMR